VSRARLDSNQILNDTNLQNNVNDESHHRITQTPNYGDTDAFDTSLASHLPLRLMCCGKVPKLLGSILVPTVETGPKRCFNRRITIEIGTKYKNKNEFHRD
jgi:hypothetical protein